MKISQNAQVLKWLKAGRTLTALQALEKFGCWRLAARIDELRCVMGANWEPSYYIKTIMRTTKTGKRIAVYRLM